MAAAELPAGQILIAGGAPRNAAPIRVDVDLSALERRSTNQLAQVFRTGVGIARRAFPPWATMPRHLRRIDAMQTHAQIAAADRIAIHYSGIAALERFTLACPHQRGGECQTDRKRQ